MKMLRLPMLAAFLVGTASTVAVANDQRPVNDPIAAQLVARGLDPVTVRAEMVDLSRAERVVRLQELGVQLLDRAILPQGAAQGFVVAPRNGNAQFTRLEGSDVRLLPAGTLPAGAVNVIPLERVPGQVRPIIVDPGFVVSSDGKVILPMLPAGDFVAATRPGSSGQQ